MKARTIVKYWWVAPTTLGKEILPIKHNVPTIPFVMPEYSRDFPKGRICAEMLVHRGEWLSKVNVDVKMTPFIYNKIFPFTMTNTERIYE